jgi:hypothetical protein
MLFESTDQMVPYIIDLFFKTRLAMGEPKEIATKYHALEKYQEGT